MKKSWFPFFASLIDDPDFKRLSPAEKVLLIYLISEFNLNGPFYKADFDVAITLGMSESKVRQARRKLQGLGWIEVKPGFLSKGKKLATSYQRVNWSKPPSKKRGERLGFFAVIHRFTFEALLEGVRDKRLTHREIVVFICLCYWQWRHRMKNEEGEFSISKRDLRLITGLPNAVECVWRLQEKLTHSDGEVDQGLFEVEHDHYNLYFYGWNDYSDPGESEDNRRWYMDLQKKVREEIQCAKAAKYS
jgi:hypothetical protein